MIQRTFFIVFILLFSLGAFANKEVVVKGIEAEVEVVGDISPNLAYKKALNEAKVEALRRAGIGETVSAQQMLFTSEVNNDFKEFFSASSQIEIKGSVVSYNILQNGMHCKEDGKVYFKVIIDAVVLKYSTEPDISFDVKIDGVKGSYKSGSNLTFDVLTTKDCYLTIFNLADNEATMLYPNEYEKSFLLGKMKTFQFPIGQINYTLVNDSVPFETNRLVFLFTKKEYHFLRINEVGSSTLEDIFSFIYSIPPDQRKTEYVSYFITNK